MADPAGSEDELGDRIGPSGTDAGRDRRGERDMFRLRFRRIEPRERRGDGWPHRLREPAEDADIEVPRGVPEVSEQSRYGGLEPALVGLVERGEAEQLRRQTDGVQARAERDRPRQRDALARTAEPEEPDMHLP